MPRAIEWTPELERTIAERLLTRSLAKICQEDDDLPSRAAINARLAENKEFWTICARSRQIHALQRLDDYQVKLDEVNADDLNQISLKLLEMRVGDARWYAERLLAKDYAPNQKHTGADGESAVAFQIVSTIPRPPKDAE